MHFVTNFFYKLQQYHVIEISSTVETRIHLEERGIAFTVFLLLPLEDRGKSV